MLVTIDRIEGDKVILELEDLSTISVDKRLFPNCQEKDIFEISKNIDEMKNRENKINNLMDELFN